MSTSYGKYRISKHFSESKILRFKQKIEYQILAGRYFSDFLNKFILTHYIQAGCIVSDTQF